MKRVLRKILAADKRQTQGTTIDNFGIGNMHLFLMHLSRLNFEPKVVFDIGAHECTWTETCSSVFGSSKYYLFEPQIEKVDFLVNFCKSHQGSKYFINGVGDKPGELELTIWEDQQGTSFRPSEIGLNLNLEKRLVEVKTIDSFIEGGVPIPDLVKIDVQGYEEQVIRGADLIHGKTELFILEVSLYNFMESMDFYDIVKLMKEKGYVVYDVAGFARRPYDNALGQIDIVFAREDGILRKHKKWA